MKSIMFSNRYGLMQAVITGHKTRTWRADKKPRYDVGEVVSIKQSYKSLGYDGDAEFEDKKGEIKPLKEHAGWSNKMFARSDMMPHGIRITEVRQARLQEVTDEEALREGIYSGFLGKSRYYYINGLYLRGHPGVTKTFKTPIDAFFMLINKTYGWGLWSRNPIGFVYEFEYVAL